MESIPANPLLEFHPDTLQSVRKLYKLDSPARLEEAINLFDDWIKKQSHFTKKEFDRDFLERWIIINKGQLERAKVRLDKTFTLRTVMPEYFLPYNYKEDIKDVKSMDIAFLPKQTDDFYRLFIWKFTERDISPTYFESYYKRTIILGEYMIKHDYYAGFILIFDFTNTNFMEAVIKMGLSEIRKMVTLYLQGYGMRVKGFHLISSPKTVDAMRAMVLLLRQILPSKLGQRIHTHSTLESLHKVVPKDLLPSDYGGKEKPLSELSEMWIEVLSSKENIEYLKKIYQARTDESHRSVDIFNEQHLGTPGTFRTLTVD